MYITEATPREIAWLSLTDAKQQGIEVSLFQPHAPAIGLIAPQPSKRFAATNLDCRDVQGGRQAVLRRREARSRRAHGLHQIALQGPVGRLSGGVHPGRGGRQGLQVGHQVVLQRRQEPDVGSCVPESSRGQPQRHLQGRHGEGAGGRQVAFGRASANRSVAEAVA